MKIAVIGSALQEVPAESGRIHAPLHLAYELSNELVKLGHGVTYFGLINKKHKNKILFENFDFGCDESIFSKYSGARKDFFWTYELGFVSKVLKQNIANFDLAYTVMPYRVGTMSNFINVPIVGSHHDSTNPDLYNLMYRSIGSKNLFLVPISKFMQNRIKYDNYLSVVYNGVNQFEIKFINYPKDYFCWVGRVVPSKGLDIAIDLAKKLNFILKVAGPMIEFPDFGKVDEYINKIRKEVKENKNIEYLGVLDKTETVELIGNSRGLIFPSDGTEACPIVPLESLMSGTPVITTDKGPLPELIEDKTDGFLSTNNKQMAQAIMNIDKIDRHSCRKIAEERFSISVMAKGYEQNFSKVLAISKK